MNLDLNVLNDLLRRNERLQAMYAADADGGRWVTIGAQEESDPETGESGKHGGTPVYINKGGQIEKGPKNLAGKKISELGRKSSSSPLTAPEEGSKVEQVQPKENKMTEEKKAPTPRIDGRRGVASNGKAFIEIKMSHAFELNAKGLLAKGTRLNHNGIFYDVDGTGSPYDRYGVKHQRVYVTKSKERATGEEAKPNPPSPEKAKLIAEISRRRNENLAIRGKTYDMRNEIRDAGGIWDADLNVWLAPDMDTLKKFRDKLNPQKAAGAGGSSSPAGHFQISSGSGYGGREYRPGEVIRNSKRNVEAGQPEFLYVVSGTKRYVREDGLSFGVGKDSGYLYTHTVRPATDDEATPLKQREQKRAAKVRAASDLSAAFKDVQSRGERPTGDNRPDGEEIHVDGKDSRIYGGGSWFVIGKDHIWAIRNNGADGDDWSQNNIGTGRAGAIGWRIPFDQQLADKIRENAKLTEEKE